MKTAIVILNYNDYETTKDYAFKIKDYKILDLILIVDNNSSDNSYEKLKKIENDKIKVIKTKTNLGYASGNNYGLLYLEKYNLDYVIISNPDIIVEEKVIKKLIKDLDNNLDISLIGPVINEQEKKSRGWKLPKFREDLLSNLNYFHKYANKLLKYNDDYYKTDLVKVDVIHGSFFIARFRDFKKIDYFDENTFLYYEENIIGKKLRDLNLKTCVDTKVSAIHNLSVSVDKSLNSLKKYKVLKKSQRYYERKYNKLNIIGIFILYLSYIISYSISYIHLIVRRK